MLNRKLPPPSQLPFGTRVALLGGAQEPQRVGGRRGNLDFILAPQDRLPGHGDFEQPVPCHQGQMARLGVSAWCRHHGPCSRNQSPPPSCVQGHQGCEWSVRTSSGLGSVSPLSRATEAAKKRPFSPEPHLPLESTNIPHVGWLLKRTPSLGVLSLLVPVSLAPLLASFPVRVTSLFSVKCFRGLCPVRVENGAKVHRGPRLLHPSPLHLGTLGTDPLSVLLEPQVGWCPKQSLGASWVGPQLSLRSWWPTL